MLVAVVAAAAGMAPASSRNAAATVAPVPPRVVASPSLPRWTGGIDLYRSGVFTTQQTWRWCTAADVQIIRNIVDHQRDHSRASQKRYFDYMRAHNRYAIPVADGVDPAGWAAGLRRFVDSRYRVVASGSFASALRSAVTNLRRTNRPVGITVSHGNHAWVLTGFTATADPLATSRFTVTSVRVTGPLWGLQSTSYGYDMRPDRKLTPSQLKGFFTRWHYAGVRMAWEGRWVSVQPIAAPGIRSSAPSQGPSPAATAKPRSTPGTAPSPSPTPVSSPASTSPGPAPSRVPPATSFATQAAGGASSSPLTALAGGSGPAPSPASAAGPAAPAFGRSTDGQWLAATAVLVLALAAVATLVVDRRRTRARRRAGPEPGPPAPEPGPPPPGG